MKKIVLGCIGLCLLTQAYSQTLFTYGSNAVSKDEFVRAFNKNPNQTGDRKTALKEYLDLYIKFKLKVQAAYDAGLQKDQTQQFELQNFRRQIAENIINEQANVKDLVKEAFERSQKDIHLAHVFVEVTKDTDTLKAWKQIQAAQLALKQGKDFSQVAAEFSTDAGTKQSRGDLGYITVFTLPYEFENIAYGLAPKATSQPVKTKIGYHIFKNLGERKPLGSRRVAQILVAFPPNASDAEKQGAAVKADSVYQLLQKGQEFENLARTVSNDLSSATAGGQLNEFGIGQYNPEFENIAFGLKKSGEISKPFATSYGYHILKLIEAKPVSTDINDAVTLASLQEKVAKDDRLTQAKKTLIQKQLALLRYKPSSYNEVDLFAFTDSALVRAAIPSSVKSITNKTVLFSFAKQNITASDWSKFVRAVRSSGNPLSSYSYRDLLKEYVRITADEYYRNHLEEFNETFKQQIKEFKEANLLFGIMDQNVWARANVDSSGLQQHYQANSSKYKWGLSADALIITVNNDTLAAEVQQKLKNNIHNWRTITEGYGSLVTADSGRYEYGQLPVAERTRFSPGIFTAPVKNENDNTLTFNFIINTYKDQEQRSFDDARGMVISDYQQVLEEKWIAELKKKYPVKINQTVFNSIK